MELKEYLKVFKKYSIFIIVISLVGAFLGSVITDYLPSGYFLTKTFYLAGPTSPPSQYSYEGFYAQEKARNFTDSAVAILESHDLQSALIQENEALKIRKLAPQVIRLTIVTKDPARSKELSTQIVDAFNQKFIDLAGVSDTLSLKPVATTQEATFEKDSRKIYATAGLLAGFTIAVFVISSKEYFKL